MVSGVTGMSGHPSAVVSTSAAVPGAGCSLVPAGEIERMACVGRHSELLGHP